MVDLRLLFAGGNSQSHGHGQVVGDAGQLGDETELLDFLQEEKEDESSNPQDLICKEQKATMKQKAESCLLPHL